MHTQKTQSRIFKLKGRPKTNPLIVHNLKDALKDI